MWSMKTLLGVIPQLPVLLPKKIRILGVLKEKRHYRRLRRRLRKPAPAVICNNCIGGVLLHDLGEEFRSPTVNLLMTMDDCILLARHPKEFLFAEWIELPQKNLENDSRYPRALLKCSAGEITLELQHYKTFAEAKEAWARRAARVDLDNLCVVLTCHHPEPDQVQAFESLPYDRKILLTESALPDSPHSFALRCYTDPDFRYGYILEHAPDQLWRRYDEADIVHFLNTGEIRRNRHYK